MKMKDNIWSKNYLSSSHEERRESATHDGHKMNANCINTEDLPLMDSSFPLYMEMYNRRNNF